MDKHISKISSEWIRETRKISIRFLEETGFPDPERLGERRPVFRYPEWLIMFISVIPVKLKISMYIGIHKMTLQYRDVIAEGLDLKPVSERQSRDRLEKSCRSHSKKAQTDRNPLFSESLHLFTDSFSVRILYIPVPADGPAHPLKDR